MKKRKPNFKKHFLEALKFAAEEWERGKRNYPECYSDKAPSWFVIAGYMTRDFPEVHNAIVKACGRSDLVGVGQ